MRPPAPVIPQTPAGNHDGDPKTGDEVGRRRPLSILVAVDANLSTDSSVNAAGLLAGQARSLLTVMCLWRPPAFLMLAADGGVDPQAVLDDCEQQAGAWLRHRTAELPSDLTVRTLLVCGHLHQHVPRELAKHRYDELVLDCAASPRVIRRVRATEPDLVITHVGAPMTPKTRPRRFSSRSGTR